jgi:hypothetical protein
MGARARDLFLSYNSSNRNVVVRAGDILAARSVSSFYGRDDLSAGRSWFDELEGGHERARGVAVFIRKDGLGTVQRREMQFALAR